MNKVVIDTNIALSGFLSYTKDERYLLNYAYRKKISIVGTEETLDEFVEKINEHPHFRKVAKSFMYSQDKIVHSYKALIRLASLDENLRNRSFCEEDPDDDAFIRAALATGAKIIVTNDKHLLKLNNKIEDIRIIKPQKMLEALRKVLD